MRRSATAALLLVACSVTAPLLNAPELDSHAERSTVLLMRGNRSKCGAVSVGPHTLVTTLHCLEGATRVDYVDYKAWQFGWETDTARLVNSLPNGELAELKTHAPLDYWTAPRFNSVEPGEYVCSSHHAHHIPYRWDCGEVERDEDWTHTDADGWIEVVRVHIATDAGSSGAGLWDEYGHLAGICLSRDDSAQVSLFVRSVAIVELLRGGEDVD